MLHALALTVSLVLQAPAVRPAELPADTLRLEVGAKEVKGEVYAPHAARVRVYVGTGADTLAAEWVNELTHGDSAGRAVHRWVTKGTQYAPSGATTTWEIRQTYDAKTLAPYGYALRSSTGAEVLLSLDGRRVRGTRRASADAPIERVDLELDRPGFVASASDLVPLAVGLKAGAVMTAPFWGPQMTKAETRLFSVLGKTDVKVEGSTVNAWKVEERRHPEGGLIATWYLIDAIPYMVYGEVVMPNGRVRRMTEVAIRPTGR